MQPSSGQGALYGIRDEDEVRYGIQVADIAAESGVHHLVYSSTDAIGDRPTGMGHFSSRARQPCSAAAAAASSKQRCATAAVLG